MQKNALHEKFGVIKMPYLKNLVSEKFKPEKFGFKRIFRFNIIGTPKSFGTHSRHLKDPFRHLPDIFQISPRHIPDFSQTHSRDCLEILQRKMEPSAAISWA